MRGSIFILFILLFISCGKDHADEPTQPTQPTPEDTLGSGWTKVMLPDSTVLEDIFFQNNTIGYTISEKSLWKSTDGGINWTLIKYDPTASFMNLSVTPNGNVFITHSTGGGIYELVNEGDLQMQSINNFNIGSKSDVYFVSNDTGYISKASNTANTEFGLGVTYDGGNTWNFLNTNQTLKSYQRAQIEQLSFYNSHVGYLSAFYDVNYLNNGQWQMTNEFTGSITGIYAISEHVAYAITGKGQVYRTTDGGASFSQIAQINAPEGFADLHFVSEQVGYASISHNIYQTLDGGVTWKSVVSLAKGFITEIHFTDANHGWACDTNGDVFMYKK